MKTHLSIVLDRSGSMSSIRDDVIGGFNAYLDKLGGEDCTVTLYQFDNKFEVVFEGANVDSAPRLSEGTFVPRGSTALLDAQSRAIIHTGEYLRGIPEDKRPEQVIFVTITDGLENASREVSAEHVAGQIKHQTEKYEWEFVYIGANQDAFAVGTKLGVKGANSRGYQATSAGTKGMLESLTSGTQRRLRGDRTLGFFDGGDDAA